MKKYKKRHTIRKIKNLKISSSVSTIARIVSKRNFGSIIFLLLRDFSGSIQIMIKKNYIPINIFDSYKSLKFGDIIFVKGTLAKNKKNETCICVKKIKLISKNKLLLSPDKHNKIKDDSIISSNKGVYFNLNQNQFEKIIKRSKIIKEIRKYMNKNKFIEIETPILNEIPGGANARAFKTYKSELKKNFYLRISPEIYLKKAIVCGFERVYELGKNFRDEGNSKIHSPEFTFIEFYAVYKDLDWMINFVKSLLRSIIKINFKFERLTLKESIIKYKGKKNINKIKYFKKKIIFANKDLNKEINTKDINILYYYFFDLYISKKIKNPTFITNYPTSISPLAKSKVFKKNIVERFELFISGMEVADGFLELNDPIEQKKRFIYQKKKNNNNIDYNYLDYMKFGLPPSVGCGIGLDRLIMWITKSKKIKDVIIFN
ncbi:amino acid--tRNA ligase-related protein [Candidatus Vidania fulgoroideorum]